LCDRLGIERKLWTAFHPEMAGQTEKANVSKEQYLRVFRSYQQDNWVRWLALVEFEANNATSETTKCSPFFAVIRMDPRMTFEKTDYEPRD
jgi:hypothetical protein